MCLGLFDCILAIVAVTFKLQLIVIAEDVAWAISRVFICEAEGRCLLLVNLLEILLLLPHPCLLCEEVFVLLFEELVNLAHRLTVVDFAPSAPFPLIHL